MKKNGFALVAALIITISISILGVMSMQSAFFQQKMAISNKAYHLVEQASESALQMVLDTVRLDNFGNTSLISKADSNYGYLCVDNGLVSLDESSCQNKYMDSNDVFKAEAYVSKSDNDFCLIFGNTVQSIKCYDVLSTGKIDGENFEVNALSDFTIIEMETNSYGVYEF